MNRLEQLIADFCPDAVEFGKLGDFANVDKGQQLNLTEMSVDESYPVMNGGINPSGYFNEFNTEENTITVSQGGASAGYVNFLTTKFWAGAHCYIVKPKSKGVINKFLYYLVKNSETRIQESKYGAGIPGLNKSTLEQLSIPLPPFPVQEEIVRILDTFTALEAELEEELEARTKQYEYYRDALLNFDPESLQTHSLRPTHLNHLIQTLCPDGVEYEDLKNLATISRGVRVVRSQLTEKGEFPVYQNSLTPMGFFEESNCTANSAFIISAGAAGDIGFCTVDFWAADDCFFFTDHERLHNKFLFYSILCQQKFLYSQVRRASVPRLARTVVEQLRIPVPPLPVQEEIVSILDRFEALVGDLKSGLPAEIALRRKQYEYYRDQLLTFQPLP